MVGVAVLLALLSFTAATLLSDRPRLPRTPAPSADEVRLARESAMALATAVDANGTPQVVRFARRDLQAIAALANHGLDGVRVRATTGEGTLRAAADLRLADRTWLNLWAHASDSDGFPTTQLGVGAWRLPPAVVQLALRIVDAAIDRRGHDLPPITSMVRGFDVVPERVTATLAVPQLAFRAVRELLGEAQPAVDPALLRAAYERLLAEHARAPTQSLAAQLRRLFAARPSGADPAEFNRAAFVALAMFAVDTDAGRLAGGDPIDVPANPPVPDLRLGDRDDLPKHFLLSAAMAATLDPGFSRAMGEWKELDDSLPGGSGFSFVDLTADRAGLHLARAAVDPATAAAVADRLSRVTDAELFPAAATRLDEGLSNGAFTRRYGSIEAMTYAQAVKRVDRLLDGLPLYGPFVPAS